MADVSLESIVRRIEALELAVAGGRPARQPKDWRRTIGMFQDSAFMREVDDECLRMREDERAAARVENWLD